MNRVRGVLLFCAMTAASALARDAVAPAAVVRTEAGTLAGAAFRIDVPARWNRTLVVYFHGYSVDVVRHARDDVLAEPLRRLLERGIAVAQSGYSQAGWAVEQGAADSERLRREFTRRHGAPARTLALGMSMGGLLVVHALETHPDAYAGGLALCGVLAPADRRMQAAFALRAAFDAYFPGLLGALVPVPADYRATDGVVRRISDALRANPRAAAALRALQPGATDANLPGVIASITYSIGELQRRTGANPFDNRDFAYVGTGDDAFLEAQVARHAGDADAMRYLARWYTPSGRLQRPLLALHTRGDPLVPASFANDYALRVAANGNRERFVAQTIDREGHCTMRANEIDAAFGDLLDWLDGTPPRPGLRR